MRHIFNGARHEYNENRLSADMDGARHRLVVQLRYLADMIEQRRVNLSSTELQVAPADDLVEEQNSTET